MFSINNEYYKNFTFYNFYCFKFYGDVINISIEK